MRILALLTLFMTAADHWTTWLCLHRPVEGWKVTEANPISDWLFGAVGLVPGLLPNLAAEDPVLRGDTADLLGRIGHRAARNPLRTLLEDPNPDVAEIASEALEEIEARSED